MEETSKMKRRGRDSVRGALMFRDQAERAEPAKMTEEEVGGGEPVG